jgi:hypothetical protein
MLALLFPGLAFAGGTWERVLIKSLTVDGTSFELVVTPQPIDPQYLDPYLASCKTFTVKGTYAWLYSWQFPDFVTRKNHKAALAYLERAFRGRKPVLLGAMGYGFAPIDPSNKCVVRSRALQLWQDEKATSVMSYHNAV